MSQTCDYYCTTQIYTDTHTHTLENTDKCLCSACAISCWYIFRILFKWDKVTRKEGKKTQQQPSCTHSHPTVYFPPSAHDKSFFILEFICYTCNDLWMDFCRVCMHVLFLCLCVAKKGEEWEEKNSEGNVNLNSLLSTMTCTCRWHLLGFRLWMDGGGIYVFAACRIPLSLNPTGPYRVWHSGNKRNRSSGDADQLILICCKLVAGPTWWSNIVVV